MTQVQGMECTTCSSDGDTCIVAPIGRCAPCLGRCDEGGYCDGVNSTCMPQSYIGETCAVAGAFQCESGQCDTSVSPPLCKGLSRQSCDQVVFGNIAQPECVDTGRCVSTVTMHNDTQPDGQCDTECLNGFSPFESKSNT
jgi:hypothetical protein